MIRVNTFPTILFHPLNYSKLFTSNRKHIFLFLCWFSFIILGTFLIGLTTSLYHKEFPHCSSDEQFCSRQFTLPSAKQLYTYVVLQNFHQNNRMQFFSNKQRFLDSYSAIQLESPQSYHQSNIHCQDYNTYQQLNVSSNAAGYRMPSNSQASPCGKVMTSLFNGTFLYYKITDAIFLISSQGGVLNIDSQQMISEYNRQHKFFNLQQDYLLKQWIDVQSAEFVNYFTIGYGSTKYLLLGKVILGADSYQLMVKNSFLVGEDSPVVKKILLSEVNQLGVRDSLVGFVVMIWGILLGAFHGVMCFWRKK